MSVEIDNRYDACAWGSHLPALMACIAATTGDVLEVGIGHFSTPILHGACLGRKLVSVEDNKEWFDRFSIPYGRGFEHHFINADYDSIMPRLAEDKWSVVFLDHSPGGDRRRKDFVRMIGSSDFVVVHDFHGENSDAIAPHLSDVKHFVLYGEYNPPTLVASKTRTIPDFLPRTK